MKLKVLRVMLMSSVLIIGVMCMALFLGGNYIVYNLVGVSMQPTYQDGDVVLLDTKREVSTGDVIIFKLDDEEGEYSGSYVKRVVASKGDEVGMDKDFNMTINGTKYKNPETQDSVEIVVDKPLKLVHNEYYVIGDNEDSSLDSRVFGTVKTEEIVGVVTPIHIKASKN